MGSCTRMFDKGKTMTKGELVFPGIATVKLTVGEGSLQETKLIIFNI